MDNDTTDDGGATLLLDLEGLRVERVQRLEDGGRLVRVVTADETASACPECGVFASAVKEYVCSRPRDLPYGESRIRLEWSKRRWFCREKLCRRGSFTESVPAVAARARLTTRLRSEAGRRVVDGSCATVVASGRQVGLSWPTVMEAVREQAELVLPEHLEPVGVLGIDEVRRGRPKWRPKDDSRPADDPRTDAPAERERAAAEAGSAQEPRSEPAKARVLADRWHVGFTDIGGTQGMLGQVEGRTADDVAYWLACQPAPWRQRIDCVTIDMCSIFVSAIRRILPHARIVVDHFHVVKLAGDVVDEVRRRVTTTLRGRRGRDSDPEWKIRNLLHRNKENLSPKAFAKLWNTLIDLDAPGVTILKAWIAKDKLRQLLALAGTNPDRSLISHRLTKFYTWCADADIPELERLATTISTWWPYIENFIHTNLSNAKSEGYNRVVKLDARNAYGYRNPENQRLRTRCATTRQHRGCLNPG
jgi:transposase